MLNANTNNFLNHNSATYIRKDMVMMTAS